MNKQKIIKILNNLKSHWDLADGMIALIDAGFMDKETYQNMLFMIDSSIKKIPEGEEKNELKSEFEEIKKHNKKRSD